MMISDYAQLARLLVVDDEETNRRLLDRILRSAGYCNVRTLGDLNFLNRRQAAGARTAVSLHIERVAGGA